MLVVLGRRVVAAGTRRRCATCWLGGAVSDCRAVKRPQQERAFPMTCQHICNYPECAIRSTSYDPYRMTENDPKRPFKFTGANVRFRIAKLPSSNLGQFG